MARFGDNALEHIRRKQAGMVALMQNIAGHAEAEMKEGAPWTDRTSNARNGLYAGVEPGQSKDVLFLAHGVEYGVFLELAHGGNFAILNPTADVLTTILSKAVGAWWMR